MGFLRSLFGKKQQAAPARPAAPARYPGQSIIDEPELKTVADFDRHYPLPPEFAYRQDGPRPTDTVVVRKADGEIFVFLVEEGILSFDVPRQREDGSWSKRTTEVLRVP